MHDTFKVLRTSSHTIIICHINCSSVINCKWVRRKVQKVVAALRFVQDEFSRDRCAVFTDVWPGYFLRLTSIQRYFNRNIPAGLARERHLPRFSMTTRFTDFSRGQRILEGGNSIKISLCVFEGS